jgi:antirestriction protein ArdC
VSIDTINSASYVAGWLSALSNDTSLILKASAQAQKACDYMLGIKHETDVAETVEEEALTV